MWVWFISVTVHHVRFHKHGPGRNLIFAAWIVTAFVFLFVMLQALDPASDAAVVDRLPTLRDIVSAAVVLLPISLVMASIGALKDATSESTDSVGPTARSA